MVLYLELWALVVYRLDRRCITWIALWIGWDGSGESMGRIGIGIICLYNGMK